MTIIKDFTQHLIKKDIDILLSEDDDVIRNNFPKKFIDPKFHNNVLMDLMRLSEEILDAGDPATPESFKLRNLRKHILNEYMSEINQAKDLLTDYKAFVIEEFMDANNGEDIGDYITSPEMVYLFETFLRDYSNTPRLNQFLEKIYLDAHDADYTIKSSGIEAFYEELQNNIQVLQTFFPSYGLDYRDATALLMRLTILNLETVVNGGELATSLTRPSEVEENKHHVVKIRKTDFKALYEFFNSVLEELPSFEDPEKQETLEFSKNKFKSRLHLLKQRYDNCPFDKVPIHTRELENTILMSIITFAPYLNVPFIQFLINNNIRLPLSSYKYDMYPSYFIDFDNDTIQKAFIFELEDKMVNMDTFREKVLTPDQLDETNKNLIHIEKERPKTRKVRISPEKTQ